MRLNIDQYLEDGECRLFLKRSGNVIHDEVTGVVGNAMTATCEGFDIPIDGIGSGQVSIEVMVSSGEKSGTITGAVDI